MKRLLEQNRGKLFERRLGNPLQSRRDESPLPGVQPPVT